MWVSLDTITSMQALQFYSSIAQFFPCLRMLGMWRGDFAGIWSILYCIAQNYKSQTFKLGNSNFCTKLERPTLSLQILRWKFKFKDSSGRRLAIISNGMYTWKLNTLVFRFLCSLQFYLFAKGRRSLSSFNVQIGSVIFKPFKTFVYSFPCFIR